MSTLVFLAAAFVLVLVVISKIPGLEHFVKPMIDTLFKLLIWLTENAFAWGIYLAKALFFAHIELFKHLALPASELDPTLAMRDPDQESETKA